MTLSRRERLLVVLLALLLAALGLRWLLVRGDGGLGLGGSAGRRSLGAPSEVSVARLRLEDLEPRSSRVEIGRDLFRFAPLPPPVDERPAPRPRPVAPAVPKGPRLPRVDLSYLGSFGPEGRTIAVFSDGETITNAMEGEVLNGKFIVASIGYESVDLRYVDFPDAPAKRLAAGR